MTLKWNTNINVLQLMLIICSILSTVFLFAFNMKKDVENNQKDIQENHKERKMWETRMDEKLEEMQKLMIEIKLELKDKADRQSE